MKHPVDESPLPKRLSAEGPVVDCEKSLKTSNPNTLYLRDKEEGKGYFCHLHNLQTEDLELSFQEFEGRMKSQWRSK